MIKELSANVAFISCRSRLTNVCTGATKGEKRNKGGGGPVKLLDTDGIEVKVDMPFQIGSGHGWAGIKEFVNDKRKLMGLGVYRYS